MVTSTQHTARGTHTLWLYAEVSKSNLQSRLAYGCSHLSRPTGSSIAKSFKFNSLSNSS